jgi:CSLREA domain-containing protein
LQSASHPSLRSKRGIHFCYSFIPLEASPMSTRQYSRKTARQNSTAQNRKSKSQYRRTLRYESLEDRRLLAVVTVTTLADTVDFNDGKTSLREAIFAANTVPGADTIVFAPTLTANGPATILLAQGELKITDVLTITGPGAGLLTIDASGSDPTPGILDNKGIRTFAINDQTASQFVVSISGLRITGSEAGAISSYEDLRLTDVVLDHNSGQDDIITANKLTIDGSRVVKNTLRAPLATEATVMATTLTIRGSEISDNVGRGVNADVGDVYVADTIISNNAGTGLTVWARQAQILRTTISDNTGEVGGLDYLGGSTLFISDCSFIRNAGGGASFKSSQAKVTIQNSSFIDNRAGSGAGIRGDGGIEILDSEFRGNVATSGIGGGIMFNASDHSSGGSQTLVSGTTFLENSAHGGGGGISLTLQARSTAAFVDDTFTDNNTDGSGGGIAIFGTPLGAAATIRQTNIHGNHAAGNGGGLYTYNGLLSIEGSTMDHNTSGMNGGGIYAFTNATNIILSQTTISANTSSGDGGGAAIVLPQKIATLANSTITQNSANKGGGISISQTGTLRLMNTIDAGNLVTQAAPDLSNSLATLDLSFSLIGNSSGTGLIPAPVGAPDARGNLIGGSVAGSLILPKLAPLAGNGGPTMTHALVPGSPAINAGDPAAVAGMSGVPLNDQRGAPFTRVYGGRIDIGAFELQPTGGLVGDFNRNGVVDAGDYVVGRKQSGSTVVPASGADGNGDGKVNDADLVLWRSNFGTVQIAATLSVVQQLSLPGLETKLPVAAGQVPPPLQVASKDPCTESSLANRKSPKPRRKSTTNDEVARADLAVEGWLATRASDGGQHSSEVFSSQSNPADCASKASRR